MTLLIFLSYPHYLVLHSFPTRRSSDLCRGAQGPNRGPATSEVTMPRKPAVHDVVTLDELMTAADVADVLSISARTLANWRSLNMGPDYVKVGGRVRYRVSSVNIWVARQEDRKSVG